MNAEEKQAFREQLLDALGFDEFQKIAALTILNELGGNSMPEPGSRAEYLQISLGALAIEAFNQRRRDA